MVKNRSVSVSTGQSVMLKRWTKSGGYQCMIMAWLRLMNRTMCDVEEVDKKRWISVYEYGMAETDEQVNV